MTYKTKCVTYQAPRGDSINLTRRQTEMLRRAGVWPRNDRGEEYCSVSLGLHYCYVTFSDSDIHRMIADRA